MQHDRQKKRTADSQPNKDMSEQSQKTESLPREAVAKPSPTEREKVRLFVPDDGIDTIRVVERVGFEMAESFGGATIFSARGLWIDSNGQLHDESVIVIESLADEPDMGRIAGLAETVKRKYGEESVLVEVEPTTAAFI